MKSFIDEHRDAYGVEPICRVLPIAPSTSREHAARARDPARAPARQRRDLALAEEVRRIWNENFQVYGVRKIWRQLAREGFDVARCTVARLMRQMGIKGAVRGKAIRTTVSDPSLARFHPEVYLRWGDEEEAKKLAKMYYRRLSVLEKRMREEDEYIHTAMVQCFVLATVGKSEWCTPLEDV